MCRAQLTTLQSVTANASEDQHRPYDERHRTASYEAWRGQLSSHVSNAGIGLLGLTAGSMYLMGVRNGDVHKRETGLLTAEAGVDALAVDEVLKYGFSRGRPNQNSGRRHFFQWDSGQPNNGISVDRIYTCTQFI